MVAWVKNPASYDQKGSLSGVNTPDEMHRIIVGGLFMNKIVKAVRNQARNTANIARVDEIAKVKPEKRSAPGAADARVKKGDSLDEQARMLIKKKQVA